MSRFHLVFVGAEAPSLSETLFITSSGEAAHTVRGKLPGAFRAAGTFQWTSAVKALSQLFVRWRLASLDPKIDPVLCGLRGSPALSLDYAITKETLWTIDMFGTEPGGMPAAKLLFLRSNSNLRRPGPVAITVNDRRLSPRALTVSWDGRLLEAANDYRALLGRLEPDILEPVQQLRRLPLALEAA